MIRLLTIFALIHFLSISGHTQPDQYTFVFLNKRTDKAELPEEELKKIMDGHMANIERLAKEEKLIAAGPFDGGGGIFIFKSNSVNQVKEWLQSDPGVMANRWSIEIFPYTPRIGSVCSLNPPYNMVSYQFIRFMPEITKYSITSLTESIQKHNTYLKSIADSKSIITEGVFGNTEGGILVMSGELNKELFEKDPAIAEGAISVDYKVLWIAQGAFCEKQ